MIGAGENRGVFVSLRAARCRGYRPFEAPRVRRGLDSLSVRVVDVHGDVAIAELTAGEWARLLRRGARAKSHARQLCGGTRDGARMLSVLEWHVRSRGRCWARARA